MGKVTVYRFTAWNGVRDEWILSSRMATLKGIELIGGVLVEGSSVEIDNALVDSEGLTDRNFQPAANADDPPAEHHLKRRGEPIRRDSIEDRLPTTARCFGLEEVD